MIHKCTNYNYLPTTTIIRVVLNKDDAVNVISYVKILKLVWVTGGLIDCLDNLAEILFVDELTYPGFSSAARKNIDACCPIINGSVGTDNIET